MALIKNTLSFMFYSGYMVFLGVVIFSVSLWLDVIADVPELDRLEEYKPSLVSRVYADDGNLLGEFFVEKRFYLPISQIPKKVQQAFVSAEDKRFYEHGGYDLISIVRAMRENVSLVLAGRRPIGASTITQQVARIFLLTDARTLRRKFTEIITASKVEKSVSKEKILELYLNKIYLGIGTYGVASAALLYFNKALPELEWHEIAYLAALPKGPNNYHPITKTAAAFERRNWVLGRLYEDGVIDFDTLSSEKVKPINKNIVRNVAKYRADYFLEEVRKELVEEFGSDQVYGGGLSVRTPLDSVLQAAADKALFEGLLAYDRRHGWRGPLAKASFFETPQEALIRYLAETDSAKNEYINGWLLAAVDTVKENEINIIFEDSTLATISFDSIEWARKQVVDNEGNKSLGDELTGPNDVLERGDIILTSLNEKGEWQLMQRPEVDGAIIAIDAHTGRVRAMSGGWSFKRSQFNRATQAYRQPGSAFKPFVYLAALEKGYTPATRILDAPIVIDNGEGKPRWRPENYSRIFYGPATMRVGVEKSRNLMTVRLAMEVGMSSIRSVAKRLDIHPDLPHNYAMALGAGETTLKNLVSAYASIVNGGKRVSASFLDQVYNSSGNVVYATDERSCSTCDLTWQDGLLPPDIADTRAQVISPEVAYQLTSILNGVIKRGTGRGAASIPIPLGGKTGTTNNSVDAWFVGFTADLAIGVYVGFDAPSTLNSSDRRETGASAALPIWRNFIVDGLKNINARPFKVPEGISFIRIDPATGALAGPDIEGAILEAFKIGDILPNKSASRLIMGEDAEESPALFFDEQNDQNDDTENSSGGIY